jgi:ataxia telangiectasia mutated family protein
LVLSSTLSTLSLNKKHIVQKFAHASWDGLVQLWGTKNKRMKEGIIIVLRILFPFVISDNDLFDANDTHFDCAESIGRLWSLLNGEAESRWGVDCLSLDCLRLELVKTDGRSDETVPFVANTFRSGWSFDEGQALAWAILELQADCASKVRCFYITACPGCNAMRISYSFSQSPCTRGLHLILVLMANASNWKTQSRRSSH